MLKQLIVCFVPLGVNAKAFGVGWIAGIGQMLTAHRIHAQPASIQYLGCRVRQRIHDFVEFALNGRVLASLVQGLNRSK